MINIDNLKPNQYMTLEEYLQKHISILTSTDAMLMTPLHVICCNPNAPLGFIRIIKTAQPNLVLMRDVMGRTPLQLLLQCRSTTTGCNDGYYRNEKLAPLVRLLENGLTCDDLEMISLFDDDMILVSELEKRDKTSGLFPFMDAAKLPQCKLDVVYELAIKRPDLLLLPDVNSQEETILLERGRKRKFSVYIAL
jgi:hypothetical protein